MIAIYVRISRDEQSKYSISDQIAECRKKAVTDEILEYVDEGVSGEFLDRPALSKLRQDVRDGLIIKVVCLDPDRLSRKLMNQLIITDEFDKRSVELIFVNGEYAKTPEGNLFYSMRGAIAEFEKSKINERMSRGRRQKARQGKVLRDFKIYGYDYDKENEQLVINEDEAKIVHLIFDLFTKPNDLVKGINGIAHYLTKKGIPTKRGADVWHRQVVRQILMNQAYTGDFYQNRWNTEGMLGNKHNPSGDKISMKERPEEDWILIPCPTIIERDIFTHAQDLIQQSRRRWTKQSKHQYLLSGLIRCADCGNTMTGRRAKNWGTHVFEYTDIKNYSGAKHRGCGRKIKAENLENEVWDTIMKWLNQPDEIAAASEKDDSEKSLTLEETEIVRLESEINKAKSGRKRLLNLVAQNEDVSEDEVRQSLRELKEKEEGYINKLQSLKEEVQKRANTHYSQNLLQEAAEYYLNKGQEEFSFEDKQSIIRHIIREIRVFEDNVEIYTF